MRTRYWLYTHEGQQVGGPFDTAGEAVTAADQATPQRKDWHDDFVVVPMPYR